MKKLLAVLMAVFMVFALVGCGSKTEDTPVVEEPEVEAVSAKNTYADYLAAEVDTELEVIFSVQGHQSWWEDNGQGKVTVYGQCDEGGYFAYEVKADEETANKLVPGTLVKVTGYKAEWAGEVELMDATLEIIGEGKVYEPVDVTDLVGSDALNEKMNQKVAIKGLEFVEISKKDSEWDPDLYITAKLGDVEVNLCVENYLTGPESDVYLAAQDLVAGDIFNVEGFLYWYEGANPHITAITK